MAKSNKTAGVSAIDLIPPHDLDAEQSLLGAMMLSGAAIDKVADKIHSEDFYRAAHQTVFDAIMDLRSEGSPADVVSVASTLQSNGTLESVGGKSYLLDIVNSCPLSGNAVQYAGIVRERSKSRQLIAIATFMAACGYDGTDPDDAISESMSAIMGLAVANTSNAMPVATVMDDLLKQLARGKQEFISPPFLPSIHAKRGDMVVIAAGTSVGKTAVAVDWVDWWSGGDPRNPAKSVYFFEYEMEETSLAARMVSKYAKVSLQQMDDGLDEEAMARVTRAGEIVKSRKFFVENVYCDIGGLMAKIRRAAQMGADVVMVDHLGLIPFKVPSGMNHAKAVGFEVTNKLKRLASELNIVLVLLVQLNRDGQKNYGYKSYPTLQHLRDSGEIEQDASHVVLLYRYPRREEDDSSFEKIHEELGIPMESDADIMWFGVAKNRNGALGGKHIEYRGENFTFREVVPFGQALPAGVEQLDSIEQLCMSIPSEKAVADA